MATPAFFVGSRRAYPLAAGNGKPPELVHRAAADRDAAACCRVKGEGLGERLFVPEPFSVHTKDQIISRRMAQLAPVRASIDAIRVVIGELKALEPSRYGERLMLKHLPDMLQLWHSHIHDDHLLLAASFSLSAKGVPQLYEITAMPVTREWLPYESLDERALLTKAVEETGLFVKGLRYNLRPTKSIATITLQDTGATATAIHMATSLPDPEYDSELAELIASSGVNHATWRPGDALPTA